MPRAPQRGGTEVAVSGSLRWGARFWRSIGRWSAMRRSACPCLGKYPGLFLDWDSMWSGWSNSALEDIACR
jgi:hypothetical protein